MSFDSDHATPRDHFPFGHLPMHVAADTWMHSEAAEAASAVARQFAANAATLDTLVERLRAHPPRFIVTCARGSSDHAATYGKYLFETTLGLVTASASRWVRCMRCSRASMGHCSW